MSGERFLDELARRLATPMPRRSALRAIGVGVAVAAVPALRPQSVAGGRSVNCAAKPDTPVPCSCPNGNTGLNFENCCWDKRACNCHPTSANCCPKPKIWNGSECVETCASGVMCQGMCCPAGFKCCPRTKEMQKGRCYDPKAQCCTPVAGVLPKKIRTATDCPDRVPKEGHKPKANGCGPEQGALKYVLPNRPVVANFKPACDYHDVCYETCGKPKAFCDQRFRQLMDQACKKTLGSGRLYRTCLTASSVYYTAVSKGGGEAYNEAQKEACRSCC